MVSWEVRSGTTATVRTEAGGSHRRSAALLLGVVGDVSAGDEIGPYDCNTCQAIDPCTNQPVSQHVCCIAGETLFCNPQYNGSGCLTGFNPYCAPSSEG